MPVYGLPGVPAGRNRSLVVGVLALVVLVVVVLAWRGISAARGDGLMRVQFRTSLLGDGIGSGTGVRLNGIQVGKVDSVASQPGGSSQLLTLALKPDELFGLSDSLDVQYAPANLFGITEVILQRHQGGAPLRDGATVDLTAAGRVSNTTMGNLMRSLSDLTLTVLTPQLTEVLRQVGTDVRAFTPMIEAIISVSRSVADTQRYPSSFLIEQYASFVGGVSDFVDGLLKLIDDVFHIDLLHNRLPLFNTGVTLVVDQLLPNLAHKLLPAAQGGLNGYADSLAYVLGQLAKTVPDPARSQADIAELIDRIDRTFRNGPNGPTVGVDVLLRGMPGLATPLFGGRLPLQLPGVPPQPAAGAPR